MSAHVNIAHTENTDWVDAGEALEAPLLSEGLLTVDGAEGELLSFGNMAADRFAHAPVDGLTPMCIRPALTGLRLL